MRYRCTLIVVAVRAVGPVMRDGSTAAGSVVVVGGNVVVVVGPAGNVVITAPGSVVVVGGNVVVVVGPAGNVVVVVVVVVVVPAAWSRRGSTSSGSPRASTPWCR